MNTPLKSSEQRDPLALVRAHPPPAIPLYTRVRFPLDADGPALEVAGLETTTRSNPMWVGSLRGWCVLLHPTDAHDFRGYWLCLHFEVMP